MEKREKIIYLWFSMWLKREDLGIEDIFTNNVIYIESWGPKYIDCKSVKQWFNEWNMKGEVILWDILQFFHKGDQTVVEWKFKCVYDNVVSEFDGMSLIYWTEDNKIKFLKEFGCKSKN
ncbi:nuclear transport factor 2 family protein [uncultured Sneathia sp.]|uniref:nuclear transport factor 2 family protein n=1 Tax=uncultured Sneathia sp. TaxID=278067 RepID=UPI0025920309|nr:nuclear transport factor 2 family protein [uncultured Sneathia sp.]